VFKKVVNTNYGSHNLLVDLHAKYPTKVRIVAFDKNRMKTIYLDRWKTITDNETLEVRLPHSPKTLGLHIIPENKNLSLKGIRRKDIKRDIKCFNTKSKKSFIDFAINIADNLNEIPNGRYQSDDRKYTLDIFPVITDDDTGEILSTPARISNNTGRIEVSRSHFERMTVPMRLAILFHEFSHFYVNREKTNEIQADLNGLKIYLALGYPYIEAHKSFIHTFKSSATLQNIERYEHIKKFVNNFDHHKYRLCV
tara:strand:- start:3113 stop:3871 length:759 start_codon:yes stop_codon:yes gene_type:complete